MSLFYFDVSLKGFARNRTLHTTQWTLDNVCYLYIYIVIMFNQMTSSWCTWVPWIKFSNFCIFNPILYKIIVDYKNFFFAKEQKHQESQFGSHVEFKCTLLEGFYFWVRVYRHILHALHNCVYIYAFGHMYAFYRFTHSLGIKPITIRVVHYV